MSDRDQQDECPKAFYCLPESCGDCPHDQQGEQATMTYCDTCNQQTVESVSSRRYSREDLHDAEQRAFMAGHAEGQRAATERIVKWLRSDGWVGFRSTCMSLANAIERGEHE